MRLTLTIILFASYFAHPILANNSKLNVPSSASNKQPVAEKLAHFLAVADSLRQQAKVPGVGLAIVYGNKIIHTGGLGYRDLINKAPVTENTVFMIGSTTKAFTGVVAGKMVEQGLLEWKKPIINYLPDFKLSEPYVAKHMNMEDAFTHMTGLARNDELWYGQPISRKKVLQQVATLPFTHSFRGDWDYNNHMYVVAGAVLEAVGKKSWETLVEQEIFAPLAMEHSHVTFEAFMQDKEATIGYQEDGRSHSAHVSADNVAPAGAISSSPKDIAKWMMMMVNKGTVQGQAFLQPETYDYLTGPKGMSLTGDCSVRYYCIGWGASKTEGRRYLRHSGGIAGQNSVALVMPEDGFGIFVMTNQRSEYKEILADYAENIFLKDDYSRDLAREDTLISHTYFTRFRNTLLDEGQEAAQAFHQTISHRNYESSMNDLGYALLYNGRLQDALFVFQLNTEDHPYSANTFDSYGEALMKAGQKIQATQMYEKALELDPNLETAQAALKDLKQD